MRSMHFNKHFNKKASLEISIQAIVIVVLAMTILGLGLGFTKSIFKKITSSTEDISEQVRQKVVEDLVTGDKRVSFPKTEINIERGSSTVLTVGIRNQLNSALKYKISFEKISPTDIEIEGISGIDSSQKTKAKEIAINSFIYDSNTEYTLDATQSDVRNVRLEIDNIMPARSYFFVFKVVSGGTTYAEKDFFVNVR